MVAVSEQDFLYAEDVLAGKVDLDRIVSRYVFLESHNQKALIPALNHMAKFGWRAVSYSQGICLLERVR